MHVEVTEKRCSTCVETKPADAFYRAKSSKDGLYGYCKECARARSAAWRARNQDKVAAYYRDHQPEAAERNRAWRRANPERYNQLKRAHTERRKSRDWAGYSIRTRLARTRMPIPEESVAFALGLIGDPCSYCGGPGGEIDHIVPVAAGGTNDWHNLTASCSACNKRKHERSLLDALARGSILNDLEAWNSRARTV